MDTAQAKEKIILSIDEIEAESKKRQTLEYSANNENGHAINHPSSLNFMHCNCYFHYSFLYWYGLLHSANIATPFCSSQNSL